MRQRIASRSEKAQKPQSENICCRLVESDILLGDSDMTNVKYLLHSIFTEDTIKFLALDYIAVDPDCIKCRKLNLMICLGKSSID